jgi:STAS domain
VGDVTVDLAGVTFLDSVGLCVLLRARTALAAIGRRLLLAAPARAARGGAPILVVDFDAQASKEPWPTMGHSGHYPGERLRRAVNKACCHSRSASGVPGGWLGHTGCPGHAFDLVPAERLPRRSEVTMPSAHHPHRSVPSRISGHA